MITTRTRQQYVAKTDASHTIECLRCHKIVAVEYYFGKTPLSTYTESSCVHTGAARGGAAYCGENDAACRPTPRDTGPL